MQSAKPDAVAKPRLQVYSDKLSSGSNKTGNRRATQAPDWTQTLLSSSSSSKSTSSNQPTASVGPSWLQTPLPSSNVTSQRRELNPHWPGHYHIGNELLGNAGGSKATVHKARHKQTGQAFACKIGDKRLVHEKDIHQICIGAYFIPFEGYYYSNNGQFYLFAGLGKLSLDVLLYRFDEVTCVPADFLPNIALPVLQGKPTNVNIRFSKIHFVCNKVLVELLFRWRVRFYRFDESKAIQARAR